MSKINVTNLWTFYEIAVQQPSYSVDVVSEIYKRIFRKTPLILREDFCGTFAVGREWVRRGPKRKAFGLDISKPVAREAIRLNGELLELDEQRRAAIHCADARTVTRTKSDVILVENFSFYVFKTRSDLLDYFKACHRSLKTNGLITLDLMGGPEYTATSRAYRTIERIDPPRAGLPKKFIHFWNQKRYDPATGFAWYSIDFEVAGKRIKDAFTYDWRVWTVPEVRDCLLDAGFDEVKIFWDDDEPKNLLREVRSIPNTWEAWACQVTGIKRKTAHRRNRHRYSTTDAGR